MCQRKSTTTHSQIENVNRSDSAPRCRAFGTLGKRIICCLYHGANYDSGSSLLKKSAIWLATQISSTENLLEWDHLQLTPCTAPSHGEGLAYDLWEEENALYHRKPGWEEPERVSPRHPGHWQSVCDKAIVILSIKVPSFQCQQHEDYPWSTVHPQSLPPYFLLKRYKLVSEKEVHPGMYKESH